MVLLQRKTYFSKDPEGVQPFPGGGGGPHLPGEGGVQILIFIEPHITCDFLGGGGVGPPMVPHINSEAVMLIETGVWI